MLVVLRPTIRQSAAAAPRLAALAQVRPADAVILHGAGGYGNRGGRAPGRKALGGPVAAVLPP